jgi:hypothetical protein
MRGSTGFVAVLVLVAVVVVIGAVAGAFSLWHSRAGFQHKEAPSATPTPPPGASTWKTFSSQVCGYALSYPPGVELSREPTEAENEGGCQLEVVELKKFVKATSSPPYFAAEGSGSIYIKIVADDLLGQSHKSLYEIVKDRGLDELGPLDLATVRPWDSEGFKGYTYSAPTIHLQDCCAVILGGFKEFDLELKPGVSRLHIEDYLSPFSATDPDVSTEILATLRPHPL